MTHTLIRTVGFLALLTLPLTSAQAQTCPLSAPQSSSLAPIMRLHGVLINESPAAVTFTSGVERDEDGAPNAYHAGLNDDRQDPGLDHICSGGDVLEFSSGKLHNKYAEGGSIGKIHGFARDGKTKVAILCKRDYIAIRDANFPVCGPGHLCMRWYGVAVSPQRSCGYNYADDKGCGVPIKQTDSQGKDTGFYLTTNTLRRQESPSNSQAQADYADATQVPFIVVPSGVMLPTKEAWGPGDLAIVSWHGRVAYAVIGDSGPKNKLGEGSRALLADLGTSSISADDPATTLVFPGTARRIRGPWPLTKTLITEEARKVIKETHWGAALSVCPGLQNLR